MTERLKGQQTCERTGSRPIAAGGGGAQRQPWARPITGLRRYSCLSEYRAW